MPVEIGKLPQIELFNIEENKACKAPPAEVRQADVTLLLNLCFASDREGTKPALWLWDR